jgi:g-D-glutamyl-meso-diaminopimelate peptidase
MHESSQTSPTTLPPARTTAPESLKKPTQPQNQGINTNAKEITETPSVPAEFKNPVEYEVIGYSLQNRPLEVFRFGTGPIHRLIVAGIHGGYEWNTIALADELIVTLKDHPEQIPSEVTLHILRALNPDGLANSKGYEGRANARGVDLNRNWPIGWEPEWPLAGCWNYRYITAGPSPASEPEIVSLMNYMIQYPFDALISYHSAALGIFPGGQPPHQRSQNLAEAIAEISPYPYPPIETSCLYTGQFVDWAAYYDIAAVDIELSTHFDLDYEINLDVLDVFLHWGLESRNEEFLSPLDTSQQPAVESR